MAHLEKTLSPEGMALLILESKRGKREREKCRCERESPISCLPCAAPVRAEPVTFGVRMKLRPMEPAGRGRGQAASSASRCELSAAVTRETFRHFCFFNGSANSFFFLLLFF